MFRDFSIPVLTRLCLAALLTVLGRNTVCGENLFSLVQTNDVTIASVGDDEVHVVTTGHDPYIVWKNSSNLAHDRDHVLTFEYFSAASIDEISGFVGPPLTESTRFDLPDLNQAEGWQSYTADLLKASGKPFQGQKNLLRIDFGVRSGISFRLRSLRLRAPTPGESRELIRAESIRESKLVADRSIQKYLASNFPLKLDHIEVGTKEIRISAEASGPVQLFEIIPSRSIAAEGLSCPAAYVIDGSRLTFLVPRFVAGRDRLHSGWRLARVNSRSRQIEYLTARHYPTKVLSRIDVAPVTRLHPKSQKGLAGVTANGLLEELLELGIQAITVNLVLNSFISNVDGAGEGGVRWERIDDGTGAAVYFDPRPFLHYDRVLDFARRHGIVVTAIVLIPRAKDGTAQPSLVHRDSDGGIYSMPPLESSWGSKLYARVLDRIARRYCNHSRTPGGITHWVAHNEIDFHAVWTNMGKQPRSVVIETYYRSMRMISQSARQYNPQATVFASLTHHWHVPDDGRWSRLAPREVLETLQRYTELEGDFAWGIAYHPYPQSLFSTVAWDDREAVDDFDTPYITIQNLEVLGRFLKQAAMRDTAGKIRTVLLSEQGFHTADYSERSQRFQAESLSFAMQRVKQMPWIESFHYHRWIDHPDEGGLKLGLRTLPSSNEPHGLRKQSWYVYQAIE